MATKKDPKTDKAPQKKSVKGAAESKKTPTPHKKSVKEATESKKTPAPQKKSVKEATESKKTPAPQKKAPKVLSNKDREEIKKESEKDVKERIDSGLSKFEGFLFKHGKSLLTALIVVVAIIGAILIYQFWHLGGKQEKASESMYVAEQLFIRGEYEEALLGDGVTPGFVDVASKYGSTPQGNIANHYAGLCYIKLDQLDQAMIYLSKYKSTKGVPNIIINVQNKALQGDLYVQKEEYEEAAKRFEKAMSISSDKVTTPQIMIKLARVYEKLGRTDDAKAILIDIIAEYNSSEEARTAEKYIGSLENI